MIMITIMVIKNNNKNNVQHKACASGRIMDTWNEMEILFGHGSLKIV
jgi:hypothetical protein